MADRLLESGEFDVLVILVPALHPDKVLVPGINATFEQRLDMLRAHYADNPRVGVGMTRTVLYGRLLGELKLIFSTAEMVTFGLGADSYDCLTESRSYYETMGEEWSAEDEAAVAELQKTSCVFNRQPTVLEELKKASHGLEKTKHHHQRWSGLPPVSSTDIRDRISRGEQINDLVPKVVAHYIQQHKLYNGV